MSTVQSKNCYQMKIKINYDEQSAHLLMYVSAWEREKFLCLLVFVSFVTLPIATKYRTWKIACKQMYWTHTPLQCVKFRHLNCNYFGIFFFRLCTCVCCFVLTSDITSLTFAHTQTHILTKSTLVCSAVYTIHARTNVFMHVCKCTFLKDSIGVNVFLWNFIQNIAWFVWF